MWRPTFRWQSLSSIDVLPTFGYTRVPEAAMPKLRFAIAALAALFAGYLGGVISRPAPLVATLSALPVPDLCWRPGLARNIGIAETPCP
jgi:hypothetical protein